MEIHLLVGAVGVPVFAGFKGGLGAQDVLPFVAFDLIKVRLAALVAVAAASP